MDRLFFLLERWQLAPVLPNNCITLKMCGDARADVSFSNILMSVRKCVCDFSRMCPFRIRSMISKLERRNGRNWSFYFLSVFLNDVFWQCYQCFYLHIVTNFFHKICQIFICSTSHRQDIDWIWTPWPSKWSIKLSHFENMKRIHLTTAMRNCANCHHFNRATITSHSNFIQTKPTTNGT